MTTLASTRPSPLATVVGPPVAGIAAASVGVSIMAIEKPPKGLFGVVPSLSSWLPS